MRVVISGGSGLIGRRLVDRLIQAGHRAVVLSRSPERVTDLPEGAAVAPWDREAVDDLAATVSGADAVVHLAGENIGGGRWTASRKRRIRDSRVEGSRAVAEAIERAEPRPPVLIQASAVDYYGASGDEELTEASPPGEDYLATTCREWEAASAGVEALGVRRAVIRTGVVLSTRGGALPRLMLPFKLFAGGPAGDGRQWLPWIHVEDEVGAIRFLIERTEAVGPFNLTSPQPLTNRDFGKVLGSVMGRPSLLPAPAFALKLALGEMSTLVLDGQRALPARLVEHGFAFRFPEARAALEDLLA